MRNHARSVLACDFFVAVTAGFRMLCIFVVLEVGTRRILHWNVTDVLRQTPSLSLGSSWACVWHLRLPIAMREV